MRMDGGLPTLIIIICVAFLAFLILREFFCWYWKLNRINRSLDLVVDTCRQTETVIKLLENINTTLATLVRQNERAGPPPLPATERTPPTGDAQP